MFNAKHSIHTTGKIYTVRQAWREIEPHSPLPSAGPLKEAATEGVPDGDVALVYCGRIEYVERGYAEEVRS